MSSKAHILCCLLLAACSGSSAASIDALARPEEKPPTTFVTVSDGGEPAKPTTPLEDAAAVEDASVEADADASEPQPKEAGPDLDASTPDADAEAEAPTPRYGVSFNGEAESAIKAPEPAGMAGQASLTFETWYRLNAASDRGAIMTTPYAHCAVTTGGPATIHCCANYGSQTCVVSPVVASQGVWYHVAWVLSAGNWALFVDGQKQGEVPSPYQSYPSNQFPQSVYLGAERVSNDHAAVCTVDEFRLSFSALYTANFTPPKHLDAPGALNLLLDEGTGTTSGSATLCGNAVWSSVTR